MLSLAAAISGETLGGPPDDPARMTVLSGLIAEFRAESDAWARLCGGVAVRALAGGPALPAHHAFDLERAAELLGQMQVPASREDKARREVGRFVSGDVRLLVEAALAYALGHLRSFPPGAASHAVDHVTGLMGRQEFFATLDRMRGARWPGRTIGVLHLDLARMRRLNALLGHAAGDAVLRNVGSEIAAISRAGDLAVRISGDEFVHIRFGDSLPDTLRSRAAALLNAVSTVFPGQGKDLSVSARIGLAWGDEDQCIAPERFVHDADLAVRAAKTRNRSIVMFTPELRVRKEADDDLTEDIRRGLAAGEFMPYFQPQIAARSGRPAGFEMLARWNHPRRGVLAPPDFLAAALSAGLGATLDRQLVRRAMAALRAWEDLGLAIGQVSLNLTPERLAEPGIVEELTDAAAAAGVAHDRVGVEVLESAMLDGPSGAIATNLRALSRAGFRIELDDFGTGHAAISNLRHLAVDRIKIDQSFVRDIHIDGDLAKITAAMIGLAHSLRIDALAEGVEKPEERLVLNALGCDFIQGNGVSRPMPEDEVECWLRKAHSKRRLPSRKRPEK